MPITITFISLKKAGRCVQCQECHAPKKRAGRGVQCEQCEALKRRFGVVPRRYRPRFGGTFAAKFCGDFAAHFAASP